MTTGRINQVGVIVVNHKVSNTICAAHRSDVVRFAWSARSGVHHGASQDANASLQLPVTSSSDVVRR